jgi:hypothetical protein
METGGANGARVIRGWYVPAGAVRKIGRPPEPHLVEAEDELHMVVIANPLRGRFSV